MAEVATTPPSHRQLFVGMQQVALSSFGGGLSAWSERIVVEERQWMSKEEFITGLTVARLFPGPNQINMAVYIGSYFRGLSGAIAALLGILLLPFTLLMLLGLGYYYLHETLAVDRVLSGVITASAGMAVSMGLEYSGYMGMGHRRSPVRWAAASSAFCSASLLAKQPAAWLPSAMPMAPVSVARFTTAAGL